MSSIVDEASNQAHSLFIEVLEEFKNKHNLSDSINELEVKYFTNYLYILKYVFVFKTKHDSLKGNTAFSIIRDKEEFIYMLKKKSLDMLSNELN